MGYGRTPAPSADNYEYCCCNIPGVKLIWKTSTTRAFRKENALSQSGLEALQPSRWRYWYHGRLLLCTSTYQRQEQCPFERKPCGWCCSSSRAKQRFARTTSHNDFRLPRKNATRRTVYIILQVNIPPARFTSLFLWLIRIRGTCPKAVRSCFWGRGKRFRGNEQRARALCNREHLALAVIRK